MAYLVTLFLEKENLKNIKSFLKNYIDKNTYHFNTNKTKINASDKIYLYNTELIFYNKKDFVLFKLKFNSLICEILKI